ncbi:MAG: TIGR01212 family radical SAM protein, partial [Rikenellaceae bacterium]|nr:TIGR01212 family radical SAM protein [Rikenellaceae bacterium]
MDKKEARIYPWGDSRRYNSYARYFRSLFGQRIQKVTIDAGFTCPNRDGTVAYGGCTYCNNKAFNPSYCTSLKSVTQQIEEGKEFHAGRYRRAAGYLAYFQAYSNTYKPLDDLKALYEEALSVDGVVGIVIGTRPDCVDDDKLDYLAELSKRCHLVVEYGIESVYDRTLARINRGHDFECARKAVVETAARGIHTGAHFILGLPGESRDDMLESVKVINTLPLETIKFHQLQVFRDTIMERDFMANPHNYSFFECDEYIDLFCDILARLKSDIVVERFAGEAPPRFHIGPSWGLIRNNSLIEMLEQRLLQRDLWQGCLLC